MVGDRYRTRLEMAEYFRNLAYEFEKEGHRADNDKDRWKAFGKAEAYINACFELQRNMED